MNEIVIISGKGGTGKTSVSAAFAYLGGKKIVTADCDVDAADLHLILKPKIKQKNDFYGSMTAIIEQDKCIACDECFGVCHFDAVIRGDQSYTIDTLSCEGCAYCEKVCPTEAIKMVARLDGEWYVAENRFGAPMIFAKLGIGTENSGKLVSTVKNAAIIAAGEINSDLILIDGPPGISCPVISVLSGARYAVIVTEPTVSGIHDLKRVWQITKRFNVPVGIIINKSDLNKTKFNEIINFINEENLDFLAEIPYNENFTKAMTLGITVIEYEKQKGISGITDILILAWRKILKINNLKI